MTVESSNPDHAGAPVEVAGEVCIANIGPRERRKRAIGGYVLLAVAFGITAALVLSGLSRWWRLLLFLPFVAAGTSWFQAREHT